MTSVVIESFIGILALIAAASLFPGDYFAINVSPEKFQEMGLSTVNLTQLAKEVGEEVAGRPGGAVSLAVGMAQIFSSIPGMGHLMSYWYHFAIMFEALFILTTIDTGTRIGRFLLQEFAGKVHPKLGQTDWFPGTLISSALIVAAWSYFILTGSISTIWPMFGISNQLLAAVALSVATAWLTRIGKKKYIWVTLIPMSFVAITTLIAGWQSITDIFYPLTHLNGGVKALQGWINISLTSVIMAMALIIMTYTFKKCRNIKA